MNKIIDQEINNLFVDETRGDLDLCAVFDCCGVFDVWAVFEDFLGETIAPVDVFGEIFGDDFGEFFGDTFGDGIPKNWHSFPEYPAEQLQELYESHVPLPEHVLLSVEFLPKHW